MSSRLYLILFAALTIAACGGGSSSPSVAPTPTPTPTPSPTPTPTPTPTLSMTVSMVKGAATMSTNAFSPNPLTVAVGTTVTWVNNDTTTHDATADSHAFATGSIAPGASASVTLQTAGRITYACTIHPGMTGTITVQ